MNSWDHRTRFAWLIAVIAILFELISPRADDCLCAQEQSRADLHQIAIGKTGTLQISPTQTSPMPSANWFDEQAAGYDDLPAALPASAVTSTAIAATYPSSPDMLDGDGQYRNRALELVRRDASEGIRRYKKGFFQRLEFNLDSIDPGSSTGLGVLNLKTSLSVAIPLGSFENLLIATPSFEVGFMDADAGLGIPDRLYNTGIDFMWRKQFNDRWGTMIAVSPGYSSDFESSDDAFRIRGRALATWQWVPKRFTLIFGVVYLDRDDLPILPGFGAIWTPNPDWRLDLIFPRPKIAYRLAFEPGCCEHWAYLRASIGGGTWAVDRMGTPDQLTLRDYRLSVGWERIVDGGGGLFIEAGFAFGRELEYEVSTQTASFDDAFFLSGGIRF